MILFGYKVEHFILYAKQININTLVKSGTEKPCIFTVHKLCEKMYLMHEPVFEAGLFTITHKNFMHNNSTLVRIFVYFINLYNDAKK